MGSHVIEVEIWLASLAYLNALAGIVCRVVVGLVLPPLLHLGVEGLAAPLPLVGGLSGTPRLKSSDPYDTGVDGSGIMREAALAVWLGGAFTDLIHPLVP